MTMAHCVLLVEDNPASLELMRYLLHSAGHTTLLATNGHEALERLRDGRPDLVLTDIQMPGMDGYELLAHLRADPVLRTLPVVALTAYSMPGDQDRVMQAGFDGYLAKPIDPETILQDLMRFIGGGPAGAHSADPG